jgi:hypothetical protein
MKPIFISENDAPFRYEKRLRCHRNGCSDKAARSPPPAFVQPLRRAACQREWPELAADWHALTRATGLARL